MSFTPLPAELQDLLGRTPRPLVAELGCGGGGFSRILTAAGGRVVGLDASRLAAGGGSLVVGDARRPPLSPGAWDLVVVPNLLRHLVADARRAVPWEAWLALRRPRGALFVLEDEPTEASPAAANYRRLQTLLAELPNRGPLLPLAAFRERRRAGPVRIAAAGIVENRYPVDAGRVRALLNSGRPAPDTAARTLATDIDREGISLGSYWWARIERRREA